MKRRPNIINIEGYDISAYIYDEKQLRLEGFYYNYKIDVSPNLMPDESVVVSVYRPGYTDVEGAWDQRTWTEKEFKKGIQFAIGIIKDDYCSPYIQHT